MSKKKNSKKKQLEIKIVQYLSLELHQNSHSHSHSITTSANQQKPQWHRVHFLSRALPSLSLSSSLSSRCPERARSDLFLC
jgi:hypothetical protein